MVTPKPGSPFVPSHQAVEILRHRLHRLGFPIDEPAARSVLESVLAVEMPRLGSPVVQTSLEIIRRAAEDALSALGRATTKPSHSTSGQHAKVASRRPVITRRPLDEAGDDQTPGLRRETHGEHSEHEGRPVFKRPRGR